MRTIAGVLASETEARETVHELETMGIPGDEIILATGDGKDCLRHTVRTERNMAAAAASGAGWLPAGLIPKIVSRRSAAGAALIGAAPGALAGILGGLIVYATPGSPLGPMNPFAAVFCGMALGAAGGALAAWMFGVGVSHEAFAFCSEAGREHGIVVAAHVAELVEPEAMRIMQEHGAAKLRADADPWVASGWTGPHPPEQLYPSDSSVKAHDLDY